ncbi:MAG: IPT/TIG domain-containing protein [Bacillota bacterium]
MFKRSRVRSWVAVLLTFFFVVGLFPNTTPEAWAADGIEITRISPDAGSAGGCIIEIQGSGLDNVNKVDVLIGTYIIEAQLLDPTSYSKVFALLPDVSTYMGGAPEKSVTIRVITDTGESDSCNFVFIADPSLSGMTLNTDIYLTRNAQGQITGSTKETQAVLTGTCLHRPLSTWRIGERPVNVLTDIRHQDYSLLVGKLPDGLHMGQEVNVYLETVYGGISDLAGDDAVMLNPPPDITNLNKNQVVVGEELLIQGTGFVNGSEVEIAGGSVTVSDEPTAENRVSIDGKTIHIKVPQPLDMTSGKKDVRVILPNGSSATLKEELEILPTPGSIELKTVTPNRGSVNGGTVVQIVGFGLQSGMQVFFGDQAATNVTLVNPPAGAPPDTTILQATTPIGPPLGGPVNVTVRDPFNPRVIGILHEGFTYAKVGDDLYVGKVTPENGVETGGEEVWVEGSNFLRFRDGGTDRKINGTDLSADLHELQTLDLNSTIVVTQEKVIIDDPLYPGDTIEALVSRTLSCTFGGNYATITRVAPREDGTWLLTGKTPKVTLQSRAPEEVDVIITTLEEVFYAKDGDPRKGQKIESLTIQEQERSNTRFTYHPVPSAPEIDKVETLIGDNSIAPAKGSIAGGTTVKITGLDFQDNAKVYFGAKEPARQGQLQKVEYGALDPSKNKIKATLTVITPPSEFRGLVDVIVVNPDKGECRSRDDDAGNPIIDTHFEYISNPSVTKITPNLGPKEGGVYLTIEGNDFYYIPEVPVGTEGVYFGGQRASDIRVYTADGERLTAESPASRVGQKIKACVPASTAGNYPATVDVTVKNVDEGQVTVTEGFTYLDPTEGQKPRVDSLSPTEGSIEGGTPFVIKGGNFGNEVMVTFDGEPAVQVEVGRGGIEITGKTPPGMEVEKKVPVQVIRLDTGGLYTLPEAFIYHRITTEPSITDFTPTHGGAGTVLTINGAEFVRGNLSVDQAVYQDSSRVYLGDYCLTTPDNNPDRLDPAKTPGVEANSRLYVVNDTQIKLVVPDLGNAGDYELRVVNPDTATAVSRIPFKFQVPASTPEIIDLDGNNQAIEPNQGSIYGGTVVTIEGLIGENFHRDAEVYFGAKPATDVEYIDYQTLKCKTPANDSGSCDVTVRHPAPDFGEAILRGGYTYDRLFPEEPTGFTARLIGHRYVQLSWDPVEGASNYELFAQTDDDEDLVFLASTDQTSYLLKTVKEGEDYYFQLRAISDKGASPLIKADLFPLYVGYIDEEDDEDEDEDEDERPASVVNLAGDNLNIIIGNRPKNEYYLDYLDLTDDEYSRVNRVQIAVPLSLLQANRRVLVKTPRYDLEFSPRALYTQEVKQVERGAAWANWITDSAQIYVYLILQPLQPRDVERATSKLGTNYKLVGGTELLGEVRVGTRAQAIQSLNGTIDLTLKVPARQWSASETGNIYVLDPAKREWNNLFGSTNPAYGTGRIQVRRSGSYGLIVKKQW